MRMSALLCGHSCAPPPSTSISPLGNLMITNKFNLDQLRLNSKPEFLRSAEKKILPGIYHTQKGEMFLKGPIPWPWLLRAAKSSGKALHVAIALWFYAGLNSSLKIGLNQSRLLDLGVTRDSARRGLRELEKQKLVSVIRHSGRKPVVTILLKINMKNPRGPKEQSTTIGRTKDQGGDP